MAEAMIEQAPAGSNVRHWTRQDKVNLAGMAGFVLLLNVVGWSV